MGRRRQLVRRKLARVPIPTLAAFLLLIALGAPSVPAESPTPTPTPASDAAGTSGNNGQQAATGNQSGENSADQGSEAANKTADAKPVELKVTAVAGNLALYNEITVAVENLAEYLKQPGKSADKFILYLDWRPLKGLSSRLGTIDTKDGTKDVLIFDVRRTPDSRDQWSALLSRPLWGRKGFKYNVPVSVGYDEEKPVPTAVKNYELVVVNQVGFWIFVVTFALSLYVFWWLAKNKGIIRDPCPGMPAERRPYSLGRTQMAFWFFVIATSYVLIWMITSDRDSLTEQALGLLGISTATALGAAVVGASKTNADESNGKALELERATIENRLRQFPEERGAQPEKLDELNKEEAEKLARLEQIKKELATLNQRGQPQVSEGFFTDLLSDAEGISLHRFQMAIWTVVLGIIFVANVFNSLAMPELSGTLLALMGISGGTYIGFKFPEKPG